MKIMLWPLILIGLGTMAHSSTRQQPNPNFASFNQINNMNSFISIVELPALDINRAANFYQTVLETSITVIDMQGTQMGLLPSEDQPISVVITQGEGYQPSAKGVIIYLNGGADLQPMIDRVVAGGGTVVVPKTLIDEENGFFAHFLDSEGNLVGVHSMN